MKGRFHARALGQALEPVLDTLVFDVIDASFFFPDGPAAVALGKRYGVPVSIKARGRGHSSLGQRARHRATSARGGSQRQWAARGQRGDEG